MFLNINGNLWIIMDNLWIIMDNLWIIMDNLFLIFSILIHFILKLCKLPFNARTFFSWAGRKGLDL
jgi:hypothetical protein